MIQNNSINDVDDDDDVHIGIVFYSCWLYLYILTFDSRFASLSHIFDSCRSQIMMYPSGR